MNGSGSDPLLLFLCALCVLCGETRFPMPFSPILATLGYIFSPDGRRVLMIHRNARPDDAHFGKYNGLGGKLEPNEDIVAGLRREIREEAGIECDELALAGTISWSGFGKNNEDWFGFLFRVTRFSGTPASRQLSPFTMLS